MKRMKKLLGIMLLALVMVLGTSTSFAGPGEEAGRTVAGPTNTSGTTAQGVAESPGIIGLILDYLFILA